jgi:integrase/recombinase XerD
MDPHLIEFLDHLRSERGLSCHTLEAYERDLSLLFSFLKKPWKEVQSSDILSFLEQRKQDASSTLMRRIVAIKVFFRFLKKESEILIDPTLYLETPKIWQRIPEALSVDEMRRLLEAVSSDDRKGARDKAILELLYATGLRVSELCSLKLSDLSDDFVKVKGKGKKERVVPVGRPAILAIDHYLASFRLSQEASDAPLFLSERGGHLSRQVVWQRIGYYAKKAGISRPLSPHTLRHTFASHLLFHGADLRLIQEMLGHEEIGTTDRYTHVAGPKLKSDFEKYHPRR